MAAGLARGGADSAATAGGREAGAVGGVCCADLVHSIACFFMLSKSLLTGGPRNDGACADVGRPAVFLAGLAEAEGGFENALAAPDAILALDGVFLIDEAGDLVGMDASETLADSTLEERLWFALAAAMVDLGWRMALAALAALLCLPDLFDEFIRGIVYLNVICTMLAWLKDLVIAGSCLHTNGWMQEFDALLVDG